MTDHEPLDLPEELREHPDDGAPRGRSLGVRVLVLLVVLAMLLMSIGVWIVTSGILNLPL